MFKFFSATLFFIAICAQATVKDDLGGLYASAFRNNWHQIITKIEIIIESYEKNPDLIKTQKQLHELDKFVQLSDLNPEKAQEFLSELNTVRANMMKPAATLGAPQKSMNEAALLPVAPQSSPLLSPIFKKAGLGALVMMFLALAVGVLVRRHRKIRNEHFYPFEKELSAEDLHYWKRVKPALNLLPEFKGPMIFSNDRLFSLEFELGGKLNKETQSQLKQKMSDLSAELLLLSEWSLSSESTSKLVLNFPKERSAA